MNGRYVTVFTDASHCPHTRVAGWAVWVKYGSPAVTERRSGVVNKIKGSNDAERLALQRAIGFLGSGAVPLEGTTVIIQSDCQSALDSIAALALGLRALGAARISLRWVKAHQGARCARSAVNSWCDSQAKGLMRARRDKILRARKERTHV